MKAKNEFDIIEKASVGDESAFEQIIRSHQENVYFLAYRMTGSHQDADDIAQEVFISVYKNIGKFRKEAGLGTWIHRIAVNKAINRLRRRKIRKETSLDEMENFGGRASQKSGLPDVSDPKELLNIKDKKMIIDAALKKLPAKHSSVIVMFDLQEMSHSEIAKILKISEGTVRSRLHYARKKLYDCLKPLASEIKG
ncbi:sigma-70 family RNA polymerase sigma factor [bacterium]|jgi:RNA polymerase sigma-70 factor (ECF subfamily)|nr:sigma-70 family RNA polymerase sigma factor [bacterium]